MNYTLELYKDYLSFAEIGKLNEIYGQGEWEVEDIPTYLRKIIDRRIGEEIIDDKIRDEILENQLSS